MSDTARDRILARLKGAPRQETPKPVIPAAAAAAPDCGARVARLKELLRARHIRTLLYAPSTPVGSALAEAWQQDAAELPELVAYAEPVESFRERLFDVDAAVTGAAGAVADTGALILQPGSAEPRLMSLVPPVHIAVLKAGDVFPSLGDAMQEGRWAQDMPSNMLLISGPSKTADIELVLAFGVHGPKELIVFVLE
jgi:L-lactate dehydrogenase complex protein LldG